MTRIRVLFAVLAAVLLVPLLLLVQRALESLAVEREARHRTVAERVFDEMEREVDALVLREEERPFDQYRFHVGGKLAAGRSPLSRPPTSPYVLGFFQLDPDGSFRSPLRPRDGAGGNAPSPEADRRLEELERIVREGLPADPGRTSGDDRARRLAPGSTRPRDAALAEEKDDAPAGSYREALQRLDRAAKLRRFAKSAPREGLGSVARDEQSAASEAAPASVLRKSASGDAFEAEDAPAQALLDLAAAREQERPPSAGPSLQPFLGRAVGPEHVMLTRTVFAGGEAYRQGLVLTVPGLTGWLESTVLGASGLASAAGLRFAVGTAPAPDPGGDAFHYVHRFSEPLDALYAELSLSPLPEIAGAGYLYAIAVLLVVSGAVGLFALYRMVAVRLAFAERRGNFVAAVTHELKTPLTAIRMYGEMLRDGMVDSEAKRREYVSTITAESERLTRLINNVLEFSRLEQGNRPMDFTVGPIAAVVEEAARILTPHARDVGFEIRVVIEPDLPPVRFDRDAVLQVVFNLVDNALKYARDAGDRVIELRCTREGEGVAVSVRDRGPGVSAAHRARIFEPFYRGEDELTRRAVGTGIGLTLVKGLAESMGARVTPRSPDEGGFEVAVAFRPGVPG